MSLESNKQMDHDCKNDNHLTALWKIYAILAECDRVIAEEPTEEQKAKSAEVERYARENGMPELEPRSEDSVTDTYIPTFRFLDDGKFDFDTFLADCKRQEEEHLLRQMMKEEEEEMAKFIRKFQILSLKWQSEERFCEVDETIRESEQTSAMIHHILEDTA